MTKLTPESPFRSHRRLSTRRLVDPSTRTPPYGSDPDELATGLIKNGHATDSQAQGWAGPSWSRPGDLGAGCAPSAPAREHRADQRASRVVRLMRVSGRPLRLPTAFV